MNCNLFMELTEFFEDHFDVFEGVLKAVNFGNILTYNHKTNLEGFIASIALKNFFSLQDMIVLHPEDRKTLLMYNFPCQRQFDESMLLSTPDRDFVAINFKTIFSKGGKRFRRLLEATEMYQKAGISRILNLADELQPPVTINEKIYRLKSENKVY